jgi:hypothetical protein
MHRPWIVLAVILQFGVTGRDAARVPVLVLNINAPKATTGELAIIR